MNDGAGARAAALVLALLSAAALAWGAALAAAFWLDFESAERAAWLALLAPRGGLVLIFVLLLPAWLALLVWPWVRGWPRAAARLRDEVELIASSHAAHQVSPAASAGASGGMRKLAAAVQRLADAHAALRDEVGVRIAEANARSRQEAERLAALMSELPQAVVVAGAEGQVVLYNPRAAQLFGAADGVPIGLSRPLEALLPADAVEHAREQVRRRLTEGGGHATAQFVTRRGESLLRVQLVAIGDAPGGGQVLLIDDVTRSVGEHGRRDALLQRLTQGLRSALANLRAAAQALRQYPAMDAPQRERFTRVVHDEAERLAAQLDAALREPGGQGGGAWPVQAMRVSDLVQALRGELGALAAPAPAEAPGAIGARWLEVDSHAIVQMLARLARRIADELAVQQLGVDVRAEGRWLRVDLVWQGPPLFGTRLSAWEEETLATAAGPVTVRDVLDRHGAELWAVADRSDPGHARLCLQLTASTAGNGPATEGTGAPGRPIAYDFDLFHQPGQTAALDATPLAALALTVFDTETTGLTPSEGDEIIAIGAVRIVNGRLLDDETFERLVRPRRPVRASAEAIHGIGTQQLQDEPPLEQVLPAFAAFCGGSVLVAHNAAFDMRFLELARQRTGVCFEQPVLDTLLLSAVAFPGHGLAEHTLEQIAARLGVEIRGRHQALGDARAAARVFLKMLPLLAERGIVTLAQARHASQRTLQARETF